MPTVREVVSQCRTMFKLLSSDNLITDRGIAMQLQLSNMSLLKQRLNERKYWSSPNLFSLVECIPMENVPLTECCDYQGDCMVSRSIDPIPAVLECNYNIVSQGVWTIDKKIRFDEMDANRFANAKKLGLKKELKAFWIVNNYLYISKPDIEAVSGSFFFIDLIDPATIGCSNAPTCPTNPMDLEFKTLPGQLDDVMKMAYNEIARNYKRSTTDPVDDDIDQSK